MLGISGEHQGMCCQKEKGIQFLTQYLSLLGEECSVLCSGATALQGGTLRKLPCWKAWLIPPCMC